MRIRDLSPLLVVWLAACAAPSDSANYARTASADDRWGVGVSFPVYSSLAACDDDLSVESAVQSADMPSSRLGFRLTAEASEADALRVADCVATALNSGEITIMYPGGQEPPLPPVQPSRGAAGGGVADRNECGESVAWSTNSAEPQAFPSTYATAGSCRTEPVPLTEEQMRKATPAPMPLQPRSAEEEDSAKSQVHVSNEEQREWTAERMRRASPAPMPSSS